MGSVEQLEERAAFDEEAIAHAQMVKSINDAMTSAFEDLSRVPRINEVYRDAGIVPPLPPGDAPLELYADRELSGDSLMQSARADLGIHNAKALYGLGRQWSGDGKALKTLAGPMAINRWFDSVQSEIGFPGTNISNGRVRIDPNPNLQPWLFRGRNSRPGEAEELYRVDPATYRHVNETSSLVCAATYDPVIPQELPGDESTPGNPSLLRQVVERADRMIQGAMGEAWRTDTATYIHRGFSVSELVWGVKDDGFAGIVAAPFREQSTVDRWVFDGQGSELVGAEFQGKSNDKILRYSLPAGQTPETARLCLTSISSVGNNVEGVPPTRPIVSIEKLRQLATTTWGVGYQRWGVPVVKVFLQLFDDMSKLYPAIGGAPTFDDIRKTVNRLDNFRARTPGALAMKPGIDADFMSPLGGMPDILPMLRYFDELKSFAFANESATLGQSTFGSYAMAHVADNKFMRSAPFYAGPFVRTYDKILRLMILWNYPRAAELELFPHYRLRFEGALDTSKWIADVVKWWAAEPWTMPEPVRHMGATSLGLVATAFDDGPIAARQAIEDEAQARGVDPSSTGEAF